MMEFLLKTKSDLVSVEASDGSTPLHIAVKYGKTAVVSQLLSAGAKVSATNEMKDTPLHIAAMNGHKEIAIQLMDAGANTKAQNINLQTPETLDAFNVLGSRVEDANHRGSVSSLGMDSTRTSFLARMSQSAPNSPFSSFSTIKPDQYAMDRYECKDYSTGSRPPRGQPGQSNYQSDSYGPSSSPAKNPKAPTSNYQSDSYGPSSSPAKNPRSSATKDSNYQSDSYGPSSSPAKNPRSQPATRDSNYQSNSYDPSSSPAKYPPAARDSNYQSDSYGPSSPAKVARPLPKAGPKKGAPGGVTNRDMDSPPNSNRPLPKPQSNSSNVDNYNTENYGPSSNRPLPRPKPGTSSNTDVYNSDAYAPKKNGPKPPQPVDVYNSDAYAPSSTSSASTDVYNTNAYQPSGVVAKRAMGGDAGGFNRAQSLAAAAGKKQGLVVSYTERCKRCI